MGILYILQGYILVFMYVQKSKSSQSRQLRGLVVVREVLGRRGDGLYICIFVCIFVQYICQSRQLRGLVDQWW